MSILRSSIKKDIDLRLSTTLYQTKTFEKTKLAIDKYTSFDILYDVFDLNSKKYLYIQMIENTAFAPFIYNRSYELEELHENNNIFKSCTTLEAVKKHLTSLFKNNKIKLKYEDNKEIIKMEMDVVLFYKPFVVTFDLYIEMSPPEKKDEHLINLYNMNKLDLKNLKELLLYIQQNYKNEEAKKLVEMFRESDIPGIEV